MNIPHCVECPKTEFMTPAIAQYIEPGGERLHLCAECTVRYVRVASIKGLLLSVTAFDRREVENPPELPADPSSDADPGDLHLSGFRKVDAETDPSADPNT